MKKNNKGFTLVEIVIAVAILAILIGIAVPALLGNVNKSKIATDKSNAATIGQTAMLVITEADGTGAITEDILNQNVDALTDATTFGKAFRAKLDVKTLIPKVSGVNNFVLNITDIKSDTATITVSAGGVQLWPEVAETANYGKKTTQSQQ